MDIYKTEDLGRLLAQNPYPGRGIVVGKSADGRHAAAAVPELPRPSGAAPGERHPEPEWSRE